MRCHYVYKFNTSQFLESIDNYKFTDINHDDIKQMVIDDLVNEFRLALNNVVFGDPAGKDYVNYCRSN